LAGWWLPLLLVGSCLNPQPDPFPQADNGVDALPESSTDRASEGVDVVVAPPAMPIAPVPQLPASPGANSNPSAAAPSAEAPAEDADAGAPPLDAGTDAGPNEGPLVGGE
jgi:hypothetical protein